MPNDMTCKNCGYKSKSGVRYCQKQLVGAIPHPLPVAEVPSAAARFANAFSGPRHLPRMCPGPDLYKMQKEKQEAISDFLPGGAVDMF